MRLPRALTAVCLLAACAVALPAVAAADAPPGRATTADDAFAQLHSPLLVIRQEGVQALIDLLPGVRKRVIAGLTGSDWRTQVHLIEVLARDESDEALSALLKHFEHTDETQALLIRRTLLEDASITDRLLKAYRKDPKLLLRGAPGSKRAGRRRADLVVLLQRAEIEQKFLSRKSKTGSTGYYKGQYDLLKDPKLGKAYRDQALQVVAGIALDEAVPVPGVYRTGVYRFVRPHFVDEWELRGMAINAVAELSTAADTTVIERLKVKLAELEERRDKQYFELQRVGRRWNTDTKPFQDALMAWDDTLGLYGDFLACIYTVDPSSEIHELVEDYLFELERYRWPYVPIRRQGYIAGTLIRVGWYERAIIAYDEMMRIYNGSRALGFYNQACAYGNWSLEENLSKSKAAEYRRRALWCLDRAVQYGWSDIGWMSQDRDLDPIRNTAKYAMLVETIKRKLLPPPDDED